MRETLTSKRAAEALGVSESSVKRWCDTGKIASSKTPGGHRRVSVDSLLEFVRAGMAQLAQPQLLGLPVVSGRSKKSLSSARDLMLEALLDGDEEQCRQLLFDLYLAGHRISEICDEVLAKAFHEIGDRWDCSSIEVYHERRACEICSRLLFELRRSLPNHDARAPLAIGCSPEGDPYALPSRMIELLLRRAGWRAVSLGASVPLSSAASAIEQIQPRLLWLSVSHIDEETRFLAQYRELCEAARPACAIVVGGRALAEPLRQQMNFASYGDNFQHLENFAQTLYGQQPNLNSNN